mmetsp:Transcript_46974/g.102222  ORF Transcript_46974/g.102222 Transcript_46974/m.102222 type:complete len:224 (-) Transcript_46974:79-750(-)
MAVAMAAKGASANGGQRSAADILAAFRNRVDRQIAGEPDPDAKQESEDGTTFFLTTSAAVKRRKDAEEAVRVRKDLEANGRGRKRMAHEIEELPSRPPTALELLCEQIPPPEPKPRKRGEDKAPPQMARDEQKDATKNVKKHRRKAKVTNIPSNLQFKYLKELLEKATGPIVDGHIDEAFTAWLAFQNAEDAESLYNDFNGGEISGESIEVELLSDSEPLGKM